MDKNQNKNNLADFSDINDEIILREEDGDFQVFSHGNLLNLDLKKPRENKLSSSRELLDTGMEEINLAPPAPVVWDKKSSFYFDIQDEDDIAREVKKIEKMKGVSGLDMSVRKYSLSKIVHKIIENYDLNLLPELEKKLSNVILSFLKHTRTKVDILNLLKSPINESGLNLDKDLLAKLMNLLENIRNKIDEVGGIVVEDQKDGLNRKNDFVQNQEKVKNLANSDPRQKFDFKPPESSIPAMRREQVFHKRPMVTGVKTREKVVGPVDEFSTITLLAFRRLSSDPVEATQKIVDKIRFLEKESYLDKAVAIQNWRQSEVYKLYLDLGRESMEKNISIDKIIEQKILNKEKVLTKKEFSVITDLNKKLRF